MSRRFALKAIEKVIQKKKPLNDILESYREKADFAFISELCYGVCRNYFLLEAIVDALLDKPLKSKDFDIKLALILGLYQIKWMRTPAYAAVDETVQLSKAIKKPWAKGLLNALLRRYLREQDQFEDMVAGLSLATRYAFPDWLGEKIASQYASDNEGVLESLNQKASVYLRVNIQKTTAQEYLALLQQAGVNAELSPYLESAILLKETLNITQLPNFDEGYFSVQDISAQFAAKLLNAAKGDRVLDACAAPGGKTCHILERESQLKKLLAVDVDSARIEKVKDNLTRLGLKCDCLCAPCQKIDAWWDGEPFDKILLDAPCSAVGVIRRHPDIKLLRTASQLKESIARQKDILTALWPLLKPGGYLLYATCSILKEENDLQIADFCDRHDNAAHTDINLPIGHQTAYGWQILPGEGDGFYYALLQKSSC